MKLFVDSANIQEIQKVIEYGICSGCTTNPTLIKGAIDALKEKGENIDMENYIKMICKTLGKGRPISLEVVSLTADRMVEEAKLLYKKFNSIANNVVIKIPVNTSMGKENNYEGLKAIRELKRLGIRTNATLVMKPEQALLAWSADYVSPFAGRIDDWIRKNLGMKFEKGDYFPAEGIIKNGKKVYDNGVCSGVDLVKKILEIFHKYNIKTKVIAASMRNSRQVREVAEIGVHIATVPFEVLEDMTQHPKTVEGVIKFSEDTIPEYKALFE